MKPSLFAALLLVAGTIAPSAQSPSNPMRPGSWEITMQMDMPGMPMKLPPQKVVQCVTKKQLEDPAATVPGAPGGGKNPCKVTDQKIDGNKITWNMTCSEPQPMTGSGEILVDGDNYTGTMKMNMEQGQMTMKYNAKRLGDCEE